MLPSLALSRYLASILAAASLSGCANLTAIQEFGKLSADGAGYTKLTSEYVASPKVQKDLLLKTDPAERKAELDRAFEERKVQEKPLMARHAAVESYMKALADLAGDSVTSFDKELGGLADAAAASALIPKDQTDAIKAISTLIADIATNLYRQKKLREVIERGNAPLQVILAGLDQSVVGYSQSIEDEEVKFKTRYQFLIASANPNEPVAGQWATDVLSAQQPSYPLRKKSAEQYRKTIQAIAAGHQSLYDNRDKLDADQALASLKSYSQQIFKAYKLVVQPQSAGNS